jgi:4-hydroxybenzoate polyprenyltransferase
MSEARTKLPLCVDLDGTLVRSDLLVESCLALMVKRPLAALLIPLWLLRGKAYLKEQVSQRVELDVSSLPYRSDLLRYIVDEHNRGRTVVLATAAHRLLAEQVAAHLGAFDRVLATEAGVNLSGSAKLQRLQSEFGERGFVYAGNERKDLGVWRGAGEAILVDVPAGLVREVEAIVPVAAQYPPQPGRITEYLRLMRVHQWLKNLLIFLPLLAAHQLGDMQLVAHCVIAFVAFGFCASSVYLMNDLFDLPSDRRHPRKRLRAFAAGRISVFRGLALIPLLLVVGFGLAAFVSPLFTVVLFGYYLTTVAYSLWAKRRPVFDVMFLAGLYTARILAGSAAIQIAPSFWLLAFSMFLFLSLALVKRYAELVAMADAGRHRAAGRGYFTTDLPLVQSLGTASGYMAVLVLALYINSMDIFKLYHRPQVMWLTCPLLLFWISRVWLKTHRGEMHDDPIVFAVKDRISQLVAVMSFLIMLTAT